MDVTWELKNVVEHKGDRNISCMLVRLEQFPKA